MTRKNPTTIHHLSQTSFHRQQRKEHVGTTCLNLSKRRKRKFQTRIEHLRHVTPPSLLSTPSPHTPTPSPQGQGQFVLRPRGHRGSLFPFSFANNFFFLWFSFWLRITSHLSTDMHIRVKTDAHMYIDNHSTRGTNWWMTVSHFPGIFRSYTNDTNGNTSKW